MCAQPPPIKVNVAGRVEEVEVATNLDLAQLRAMSESMRRQGKHPPFGFYGGIVVDKTQVTIGNDRHDVCAGPVVIDVTMVLAARRIIVEIEYCCTNMMDNRMRCSSLSQHGNICFTWQANPKRI